MNEYNHLATRQGFNNSLRHFKAVNNIASDMSEGYNLADIVEIAIAEEEIRQDQVRSIVSALLKDKFNYALYPMNLKRSIEKSEKMALTFSKWNNLQIILVYFDPNSGPQLVNPATKRQLDSALPFLHDELLVIYVDVLSGVSDHQREKFLSVALKDIVKVLYGGSANIKRNYSGFKRRTIAVPEPTSEEGDNAPVDTDSQTPQSPPSGPRRLTPRYSVFVTNELFHNGNVEAWKKIIRSYNARYPHNEVFIWYENERINDINTLFKWGKVKLGMPIIFSIMGSEFRDIAKLQRYLFEGASPRFENFLHGPTNQILDLF